MKKFKKMTDKEMKHFENFKLAMQFLASESAYSMDDTDIFIHKYIREIWSKTSEVVHELPELKIHGNTYAKNELIRIKDETSTLCNSVKDGIKKGMIKNNLELMQKRPSWYKNFDSYRFIGEIEKRILDEVDSIINHLSNQNPTKTAPETIPKIIES